MTADHGGTPGWRERLALMVRTLAGSESSTPDSCVAFVYGVAGGRRGKDALAADLRAALAAAPTREGGGGLGEVPAEVQQRAREAAYQARARSDDGTRGGQDAAVRVAWGAGVAAGKQAAPPPAGVRVDREALDGQVNACGRRGLHREEDGHVLCPYIKRETTEQWCHTHDQDYEGCVTAASQAGRAGRTDWYPVECEHGYDACPTCDREVLRQRLMDALHHELCQARAGAPYDVGERLEPLADALLSGLLAPLLGSPGEGA